jgi:tetratricopeptide (TPR) repeat protein
VGWMDVPAVRPEVYVPPAEIEDTVKDLTQFNAMINAGKVSAKPLVSRRESGGVRTLEVFDTPEQAAAAQAALKRAEKEPTSKLKPIADRATLDAAREAARQAELARLAKEASDRESERVRLEQIARAEAERRARESAQLAEAEKRRRRGEAQRLANQGLQAYATGRYEDAEVSFRKAGELDPENKSYFFNYGVALYRNEKFNEALVYLKIASVAPDQVAERDYFRALAHYRLKELGEAEREFAAVRKTGHPVLAPSAAFYEGVLRFGLERFDAARESFEFVIDNSQDPRLDEQAEEYIERIALTQQFLKLQQEPNSVSLTVGAQYDSNILLAPEGDAAASSATDVAGARSLLTAGYERRLVYQQRHELAVKLDGLYMYSVEQAAQRADPQSLSLSLPYSLKTTAWDKGYKLSLTPSLYRLWMDTDDSGSLTPTLDSLGLEVHNTFIMKESWFATYALSVNQDTSLTETTIAADDSSATKIGLKTTQTLFLDPAKKKALVGALGATSNQAKGDNKTYSRWDIGMTYLAPWSRMDAAWSAGLGLYQMTYANVERKDTNWSLNASVAKPFASWFSAAASANYMVNASTDDASAYNKYLIMLTGTFNTQF